MTLDRARRIVRWRRRAAMGAALLPCVTVLAADIALRRTTYATLVRDGGVPFFASWIITLLIGALLVIASARARGVTRVAASLAFVAYAAIVGLQLGVCFDFGTYVDGDVLASAWLMSGFGALLRPFAAAIAGWMLLPALAAAGLVVAARATLRPKTIHGRRAALGASVILGAAVAGGAFIPNVRFGASPDVLALGALGRVAFIVPRAIKTPRIAARVIEQRSPITLPQSTRSGPERNVVIVLTESVRADATCVAYTQQCPHTPESNAAVPNRLPLTRMRSLDSFTAMSVGVILTGLPVDATKEAWMTAPLLFHYAHAAGMATAYVSAQHPTIGDGRLWTDTSPLDTCIWANDLEADADEVLGADDHAAVEKALSSFAVMREPFFAMVHLANTHYPYRVDDDHLAFVPQSSRLDPNDPTRLRNRYFDGVLRQDRAVARLLSGLRATPAGARTVVVFLSDHGESFYEHGKPLHGSSLFDTELRVPAWIDAPAGVLTDAERASLERARDEAVTQLDVAPTVLDLLGVLDSPLWGSSTSRMAGVSLLRAHDTERTAAISTCNGVWTCFVPIAGKLHGDRKYFVGQANDPHCFDTRADVDELHDLGLGACADLH